MPDARELIEQGSRYENGGVLDRALDCYRAAARQAERAGDRAEALRRCADVLRSQCAWADAIELARQSAAVADAGNLHDLNAEALNAEAAVFHSRGELDSAAALYARMLEIVETPRVRGIALQNLGSIAAARRDFETAEQHFIESYQCFQRADYKRGVVFALNNFARAALDRGAHDVAHPVLVRAEANARQLMDLDLHAIVRTNLGESFLHRGEVERAQELASAALGYFASVHNDWRRLECLRLLGDIALAQSRTGSARKFFSSALRLAEQVGAALDAAALRERLTALDDDRGAA